MKDKGFNTKLVHSGELKDPRFGNVTTPIFETSTFIYPNEAPDAYSDESRDKPYLYTRWGNPTNQALEQKYAAAEGSETAMVFASGMGAISASVLSEIHAGQKMLAISELYGQTYKLFSVYLKKLGIDVDFIPLDMMNRLEFDPSQYSLVYGESIANPVLSVLDVERVGKYCRENGVPFFVDATFATPVNQRPLDYGADLVLHSGTKYIGGHSDIIIGIAGFSKEKRKAMFDSRNSLGNSADPLQSYLALRGLKTLGLRVKRQNENAMSIAQYLSESSMVDRVYYPGLEESGYFRIAERVLKGYGGMVAFEIKGGIDEAHRFMKNLEIITSAASLGGVESLVTLPVDTTHASLSPEERKKAGISDSLVRLSIGIEDVQDLLDDMDNALRAAKQ